METPKYVFSFSCTWDEWLTTLPAKNENHLLIGEASLRTLRSKKEIDKLYPGFCSAYEALTSAGCDEYLVTTVLKYCIAHAKEEGLDRFLVRTNTLASVQTGLTLGLTGEELLVFLTERAPVIAGVLLPDDVSTFTDHTSLF